MFQTHIFSLRHEYYQGVTSIYFVGVFVGVFSLLFFFLLFSLFSPLPFLFHFFSIHCKGKGKRGLVQCLVVITLLRHTPHIRYNGTNHTCICLCEAALLVPAMGLASAVSPYWGLGQNSDDNAFFVLL